MKNRRWWWIVPALVLVLGFVAWLIARSPNEPQFEGRPLSVWFREYPVAQRAVVPPLMTPQVVAMISNRYLLVVSNRLISVSSNQLPVYFPGGLRTPTQPSSVARPDSLSAMEAFAAFGSNAAPFLAAQMRLTAWDRFYERHYTNLPVVLQKRLTPPGERWSRRLRAIEIARQLGPAAHETAPTMLRLLRLADLRLMSTLPKALRSVRADRLAVAAVIQQFGAEQNFTEVFRLVGEFGVADPGVARLLGKILVDPQTVHHREAIRLLEASGVHAAPATKEIIAALGYADGEVRYLAARALEKIAQTIPADARPEFEQLLRSAMTDRSIMVSNVARRVLERVQTNAPLPTPASTPPGSRTTFRARGTWAHH